MRLGFMLPTMPWHTAGKGLSRGGVDASVNALNWDTTLFPKNEPAGIKLPFHYEIQPMSAVERGIQRYDQLTYNLPRIRYRE